MQKIKLLIILFLGMYLPCSLSVSAEELPQNYHTCYEIKDPWETMNRATFSFNTVVDTALLGPLVSIYTTVTPKWTQERVHNFFDFLDSPVTLANNIMQLDKKRTPITIGRIITNFFLGFAGTVDFASKFDDMDPDPQGFDDTLAYYNVPYGYYFVIPFLGPSTTRGAPSKVVDLALDPTEYALMNPLHSVYYTGASSVDLRIEHNDIVSATKETSIDYYSKVRSIYIQYISKRNPHCLPQTISYSDFESANYKSAAEQNNPEETTDMEVQ